MADSQRQRPCDVIGHEETSALLEVTLGGGR
jgi:hypothetical protein